MTPSQTFELRLADAFERYLAAAPTSVDPAAMAASVVATAPAVRRPAFPWPTTPLGRAIAIGLALLLMAALLLLGAGALRQDRSRLTVTGPTATSAVIAPTPPPIAVLPDALRSATWLADAGSISGLGQTDPRIRLEASADGTELWVDASATAVPVLTSQSVVAGGSAIRLETPAGAGAGNGCRPGDLGTYTLNPSPDGLVLQLTAVADACATRRAALERPWVKALDRASSGGRGVLAHFDPGDVLELTLPPGSYSGPHTYLPGYIFIADQQGTTVFIAYRDPIGSTTPCSPSPTSPARQVTSTIPAFLSYLRSLPGFKVAATDVVIGGQPAARVTITTRKTAQCPGDLVWLVNSANGDPNSLTPGGPAFTVYLVQVNRACGAGVCGDLYLLQVGFTPAEEAAVLASMSFVGSLPTPSSAP